MLEHGGRLRSAARRYHIPLEQWLDLSTGVNPTAWQGKDVPRSIWAHLPEAWARLPEDNDGLIEAAQTYYGAQNVLPIAGSQAAIMNLPRMRPPGRIGVLSPSYAEHAARWLEAGHEVVPLTFDECAAGADSLDVLAVVNPNNPTGHRFARADLLDWHARLATRGGWLLIDEAFADADSVESLAAWSNREGLIVLRSLGKFFGLAGARVGFVLGAKALLRELEERLGPWTVAGPARFIARHALTDQRWHQAMRAQLIAESARLLTLLHRYGLPAGGGCALFQWIPTERAPALHEALAKLGIWTRLFETPSSLRFGLPGDEEDWLRLEAALEACGVREP